MVFTNVNDLHRFKLVDSMPPSVNKEGASTPVVSFSRRSWTFSRIAALAPASSGYAEDKHVRSFYRWFSWQAFEWNTDGSRILSWPAAGDTLCRTYTVRYTTSLNSPWEWLVTVENGTTYVDRDHSEESVIFYTVTAE